jgi:hypothetical protein
MSEVFPMVAPSPRAFVWLWVLMGVVLVLLVGVVVLMGSTVWAASHTRFEVTAEGLRIRGDVWGREIPAAALLGQQARVVDLGKEAELQPKYRSMGTALPGYWSGWFRLSNGEKALLFVSDWQKVVYVPTTEGYGVLLSAADPQGLVEALKRTGAGPARP